MRLFHVSEEENIAVFEPRLPKRTDMDHAKAVVWAVEEAFLPLYLAPRDCPRVVYRAGEKAEAQDVDRYCALPEGQFVTVIEKDWLECLQHTTLYLYEFDTKDFALQDAVAGFYIAESPQIPIARHILSDIMGALEQKKAELRTVDNLWELVDGIQTSTLDWFISRMRFAKPRNRTWDGSLSLRGMF